MGLELAQEFVWLLVIGLIAGVVAKLVMPGTQSGGIVLIVLLGIVGHWARA